VAGTATAQDERTDLGRVLVFNDTKLNSDVREDGETRKTYWLFGSQYSATLLLADSYDARHTALSDPRLTYVASGKQRGFAGPVLRSFNL